MGESASACGLHRDGRGDAGRTLRIVGVAGRKFEVSVREREVFKGKVLDKLPGCGITLEPEQRRGNGGDDLDGRQVLAGSRIVVDFAGGSIQVPFARRIQALEDVLDNVAGTVFAKVVGEDFTRLVLERN